MIRSGITKLLTIVFSTAIAIGIFFNPLTYGKGDKLKINMLSQGINEITKAFGMPAAIKFENMIDIIIFIEYIIFGVSLMVLTQILYRNTLRNIFFPLFIGLFSAVAMGYFGYKHRYIISGINSVAVMFSGLMLGVILYLLIQLLFSRKKHQNFGTKNKYRKGR